MYPVYTNPYDNDAVYNPEQVTMIQQVSNVVQVNNINQFYENNLENIDACTDSESDESEGEERFQYQPIDYVQVNNANVQVYGNDLENINDNTDSESSEGEESYQCLTTNCDGCYNFQEGVHEFNCSVCGRVNCLTCDAIYTELDRQQYIEINKQKSVAATFSNFEANKVSYTKKRNKVRPSSTRAELANLVEALNLRKDRELDFFQPIQGFDRQQYQKEIDCWEFQPSTSVVVPTVPELADLAAGLDYQQYQDEINKWECLSCSFLNFEANKSCVMCTQKRNEIRPPLQPRASVDPELADLATGLAYQQYHEETNKWECLACTFLNSAANQACVMCTQKKNEVRPSPHLGTSVIDHTSLELSHLTIDTELDSKQYKRKIDQWECLACTFLNSIANQACAMCSVQRKNEVKPFLSLSRSSALELAYLEGIDLIENRESFECTICYDEIAPGLGVILKDCLHQFCKTCLRRSIETAEDIEIKCPFRDDHLHCNKPLQDREIKALVPKKVYERYLQKSLAQAENQIENSFHCQTPDCKGWCIVEDDVNKFECPVCNQINCLTCQAIHKNMNCKQYQDRLKTNSASSAEARKSVQKINRMIANGEAMKCPRCGVVIMKKVGCDGVICTMCQLDICWVTKGPRWGPNGKGDVSGGCRCRVNGMPCHPQCQNCH